MLVWRTGLQKTVDLVFSAKNRSSSRIGCSIILLCIACLPYPVIMQQQQQRVQPPGQAAPGPLDSPSGRLAAANAAFAYNMYKQLGKGDVNANMFFSPGSISVAMAMTYLGARENTAAQMRETLMFKDIPEEELHSSFSSLMAAFKKTDNVTLHMANRLYADQGFQVQPSYLADSKQHYGAELALVNFQVEFEAARQAINKWVEDQTANKIQNILAPGTIDALTRAVLVNAVYFKGDWNNKFKSDETKPGEFTTLAGEKINIQMMFQKKKFPFGVNQNLHAQAIELPYAGRDMSMIIVLPEPGKFEHFEQNFSADDIINCEQSFRMRAQDVHVWLPRFKMEDSFSLGGHLAELGIKDLFDASRANLSGIDKANSVFVSKVLHKAFIEVNEEGSEAAAATAVVMMLRSLPREFRFKADRPFLFFIRENTTRSILFMGRLLKPAAESSKDEL